MSTGKAPAHTCLFQSRGATPVNRKLDLFHLCVFSLLPHHLILVQPKQPQGCFNAEALAALLIDVIHQVGPVEQLDCRSKAEHGLPFQ